MNFEEHQAKNFAEYVNGLPIAEIVRAIKSIRYGYVQVIVQDSKVVQIDRTEKTRLDRKWVTDEKGGDRQETKL